MKLSSNTLRALCLVVSGLVVGFGVAGCGKPDTIDKQTKEREQMAPELEGTWTTVVKGEKRSISIKGDQMTFATTECMDEDASCANPYRTVSQSGKFTLSHNYKSGIPNSIIFNPGESVTVVFHDEATPDEIKNLNSLLVNIRNSDETPADERARESRRAETARKRGNLALRELKKVDDFTLGKPKVLSRIQVVGLRLAASGRLSVKGGASSAVNLEPTFEPSVYSSIRYELDNGFLQITSPETDGGSGTVSSPYSSSRSSSYGGVYHKE